MSTPLPRECITNPSLPYCRTTAPYNPPFNNLRPVTTNVYPVRDAPPPTGRNPLNENQGTRNPSLGEIDITPAEEDFIMNVLHGTRGEAPPVTDEEPEQEAFPWIPWAVGLFIIILLFR